MENMDELLNQLNGILAREIFKFNQVVFTPYKILFLISSVFLLFWLSNKLHTLFYSRLLSKRRMNSGSRYAIATITRYIFVILGLFIIMGQAGFDLKTLTVVLGALGVGIGFGLQHIINNFVSGIIILFERPISVGDRVEVEGIEGDVVSINPRATTVKTNDNITHIVPNGEFISKRVINWSHSDPKVRRRIKVSVDYAENPDFVTEVLLEVAEEEEAVLDNPEPDVLFVEFGESSLNFQLRVWTRDYTHKPGVLNSKINYAIAKKFREKGIKVPYPQRDIHIKESP